MSDDAPHSPGSQIPVSAFLTSVDELIAGGTLNAPALPGQLAALDRFELLRLVGAGGMGLVFLARDPANGQKVAIKFLKPALHAHPQVVARFRSEASRLQRLAHAQLVPVLEVSGDGQKPYFVMPFFERSLAGETVSGQPIPAERVMRVALDVARALAHVHSRNLVHGDLKPANVLIDAEGGAHLGDFGLSLALNDPVIDATKEHFAGTAAYVSPQLARREGEDTRRDIYAFGALLYEMLTGRPPYQGETTEVILEKIRSSPPPAIRTLNPKVSSHLAAIAETAMAREHRDRYANMADVVSDLERVAQGRAPRRVRSGALRGGMLAGAATTSAVAALAFMIWPRQAEEGTRNPRPADAAGPRLEILRRFEIPAAADWVNAVACNADKDGLADFAVATGDSWLLVAGTGQILSTTAPLEPLVMGNVGAAADVDGDGFDEVFVGWTAQTNLHIAAFNQNRNARRRFQATGTGCINPHGRQDYSGISARAIADLEHDGKRELLAVVDTGWCKAPRGLWCFDVETGQTRWQFLVAPSPKEPVVTDLNNDGLLDVVLGSHAVNNRNQLVDGTDDAHCYVYAVANDGRLLWRREFGNTYVWSHPLVTPVAGSPEPAVFAWMEAEAINRGLIGEPEVGRIERLHPADGRTLSTFEAGARLLSCLAEDLDGDGRLEILATDRKGFLHVLDTALRSVRSLKIVSNDFTSVHLKLAAITNLTSAGERFLIFTTVQEEFVEGTNIGGQPEVVNLRYFHDASVLVLDTQLQQVAKHVLWDKLTLEPGLAVRLLNMDADSPPEIVALSSLEPPRALKFRER
jgi:hypothetical protein